MVEYLNWGPFSVSSAAALLFATKLIKVELDISWAVHFLMLKVVTDL